MQTLECPDCGKRYRIKDKLSGRKLRCPECSGALRPARGGGRKSLRSSIREELQFLSVDEGPPPASGPPKPTVHVSEAAGASPGLRKGVLLGLVAVFALAVLGGGIWTYLALRPTPPPELPDDVRLAMEKARQADVPGQEKRALAHWSTARRLLLGHVMTLDRPEAFAQERRVAEARIEALREALRSGQPEPPASGEGTAESEEPPETAQAAPPEEAAATAARRPQAAPSPAGAAPSPAPSAERLRALTAKLRAESRAGKARLVVDEPTDFLRWRAESWGDPLQLELEGGAVTLTQERGGTGKWVITLDQPLDVTTYDSIAVDVEAREPVSMSVALWTEPGASIFESRIKTAQRSGGTGVSFPLKGDGFKSQLTQWQYGTELKNPNNVTRISLFFYSRSQGPIRVRNLRLIRET
jgi:hypothetical protein